MSRPLSDPPRYTVEDYMGWNDERRYELIDGEVWLMAPALLLVHQGIAIGIGAQLYNQLNDKDRLGLDCPCRVFVAPVDVVLGPSTVVQPDVVLVCDPARLANGRYIGRPARAGDRGPFPRHGAARPARQTRPLRARRRGLLRHRRPRGRDPGVLPARRRPLWQAGRLRPRRHLGPALLRRPGPDI